VCVDCRHQFGSVIDGIPVYSDAFDKEDFFDKQAAERLSIRYADYSRQSFEESLRKTELWEMDDVNKLVGITKKFWWEP